MLPPPHGKAQSESSIRRRRGLGCSRFLCIRGSVPGREGWVFGRAVCFLPWLTGVLVLALWADGRWPWTQVGLSVGFGVVAAAASSSGDPQTSSRALQMQV